MLFYLILSLPGEEEETVDGSGFEAGSSATGGRLELDRLWGEGLPGKAGLISVASFPRDLAPGAGPRKWRWCRVVHLRSSMHEIFAAAAASPIGPATRRS